MCLCTVSKQLSLGLQTRACCIHEDAAESNLHVYKMKQVSRYTHSCIQRYIFSSCWLLIETVTWHTVTTILHKTTLHYIIIKWNAIFCPFCCTHTYYTHTTPLHFCSPLPLIASYSSTLYVHTSVCYRLLLCNCILPLIKSNCILIDCTFINCFKCSYLACFAWYESFHPPSTCIHKVPAT